MLVASIGIARSPATALAIVKELRCKVCQQLVQHVGS